MLRVTIESIPFGDESKCKTLHIMDIVNDGTGNGYAGNYDLLIGGIKVGHINQFQRRFGAGELVRKALKEVK